MPRSPSFPEVLHQAFEARLGELRAVELGEVTAWDRAVQTATVQPVVLRDDGTERAPLVNVPVVFPGVYWDLQTGERGLILYGDRDWKTWFRTGERAVPESPPPHDASLAVFVPGARPRTDPRTVPSGAVVLEGADIRLGTTTAAKRVVHEDLETPLEDFLDALATWATSVESAITALGGAVGSPWATTVAPQVAALKAADYLDDRVKVEG